MRKDLKARKDLKVRLVRKDLRVVKVHWAQLVCKAL